MSTTEIVNAIQEANAELGVAALQYNELSKSDKANLKVIKAFKDYAYINGDQDIYHLISDYISDNYEA